MSKTADVRDPAELARLDALAEAATPGPWEAQSFEPEPDSRFAAWRIFFRGHPNPRTNTRDCYLDRDDAEFIASARTALPALVAAVRLQQTQISDLLAGRAIDDKEYVALRAQVATLQAERDEALAACAALREALDVYGHIHDRTGADGRCTACEKKRAALARLDALPKETR